MPATIRRKLMPFPVPNYVIEDTGPGAKADGPRESPSHRLADLDADTLAQLCDEFRVAVFAKAG